MINDEVLAKLEEDVRLWGFSTGTRKRISDLHQGVYEIFSDRPIADLIEHDIFHLSPTRACGGKEELLTAVSYSGLIRNNAQI